MDRTGPGVVPDGFVQSVGPLPHQNVRVRRGEHRISRANIRRQVVHVQAHVGVVRVVRDQFVQRIVQDLRITATVGVQVHIEPGKADVQRGRAIGDREPLRGLNAAGSPPDEDIHRQRDRICHVAGPEGAAHAVDRDVDILRRRDQNVAGIQSVRFAYFGIQVDLQARAVLAAATTADVGDVDPRVVRRKHGQERDVVAAVDRSVVTGPPLHPVIDLDEAIARVGKEVAAQSFGRIEGRCFVIHQPLEPPGTLAVVPQPDHRSAHVIVVGGRGQDHVARVADRRAPRVEVRESSRRLATRGHHVIARHEAERIAVQVGGIDPLTVACGQIVRGVKAELARIVDRGGGDTDEVSANPFRHVESADVIRHSTVGPGAHVSADHGAHGTVPAAE